MTNRRCFECGGTIRPIKVAGRMTWYQNRMVEIPEHISIPTCDECGEEWIDQDVCDVLDRELQQQEVEDQ